MQKTASELRIRVLISDLCSSDLYDKILQAAKDTGQMIEAITRRTTQAYHDDMAALCALPPTVEPRATQHIFQMVAMIEALIDKGHAYAADGHVLFRSEEHTSELKSLMRISYAVFCLKNKTFSETHTTLKPTS